MEQPVAGAPSEAEDGPSSPAEVSPKSHKQEAVATPKTTKRFARKLKVSKRSQSRSAAPRSRADAGSVGDASAAKFPRHSVEKALRVPRVIIDQNAGKECSDRESADFAGVGFSGPYRVELSSSLKYGFLERPRPGHIAVTDRARQALRPQTPGDEITALRAAILDAPDISTVYKHYRGETFQTDNFSITPLLTNSLSPLRRFRNSKMYLSLL